MPTAVLLRSLPLLATVLLPLLLNSCKENTLDEYPSSLSALNIAKGTVFGSASDYPSEYSFNAYFLGSGIHDYTLRIPVRLQGLPDNSHDRHYRVSATVDLAPSAPATVGIGFADALSPSDAASLFTLSSEQTFRRGLTQDSITLVIHLDRMDETLNYRLRLALEPGDDFQAGVPEYQYIDISFTKNLSIAPAFWQNNSKLRKLTYSARKCAVFLMISGITDPNWTDDGSSVILDYWISLCTQWFLDHEEYDADGNRIYFDS